MAKWRVRSPAFITLDDNNPKAIWTLKTNQNRRIVIPVIRVVGMSTSSSDKPVHVRIQDFPTDGSDQQVITPVAVEPDNTDGARFAVNRQSTTPPSGTEGPNRYDFYFFPQSVQADPFLDPTDNSPIIILRPGRFYYWTLTRQAGSGTFDAYVEALAID